MDEVRRLILLVSSGILGLLVGSFLNVCIFRLPRNCMSIVRPRSRCPKCLSPIAAWDNIPVVSWLLLGGKCRGCRVPIPVRYTLVELLAGVIFLYAGFRALGAPEPGLSEAVRFAVESAFASALIVCTFVDLEFEILPDEITLGGAALGLLLSAVFPFLHPDPGFLIPLGGAPATAFAASALGAGAGAGSVWLVGVLGKLLFRRRIAAQGETEAMGLGDVKFMAMMGAVLGWRGVLFSFVVACLFGAAFGVGKFLLLRRMGYVPFGPFLSAGGFMMMFWPTAVDRALQVYLGWMQRLGELLLRR